jgi:hypothetical protein
MIEQGKKIKDTYVSSVFHFIPKEFKYLNDVNKIHYNGINLKTDYLKNIIHEILMKFFNTNENKFNLYSEILKKKYGKHYNYYMDYLLEKNFIGKKSGYYVGKKAKTYQIKKLDFNISNITTCYITDNVLLKKYQKPYLLKSVNNSKNNIDEFVKTRLKEDIYHTDLDYKGALKFLNDQLNKKKISENQYFHNLNAIENINHKSYHLSFDIYGRFHTNYTNLKKEIREKYITIDGEEVMEIDIPNSQPFFLAIFLKKYMKQRNILDSDFEYFFNLVKDGVIYEFLMDKFPEKFKTRKDSKEYFYKILFGQNKNYTENKFFIKYFPVIFKYIKEIKKNEKNYKIISHILQKDESNFLFNTVISKIYKKFPKIRLITIHDSIIFPIKYKNEVELIFHYEKNKLNLF